ncbi:MAG: DNA polymerase III, partial [Terriglobia bacterium]
MENSQIAAIFEEIANLVRILQEDAKWQFKAIAYDRARRVIESHPERLADICHDSSRKLTDIAGIGADLATKVRELVETGSCQYHQQ